MFKCAICGAKIEVSQYSAHMEEVHVQKLIREMVKAEDAAFLAGLEKVPMPGPVTDVPGPVQAQAKTLTFDFLEVNGVFVPLQDTGQLNMPLTSPTLHCNHTAGEFCAEGMVKAMLDIQKLKATWEAEDRALRRMNLEIAIQVLSRAWRWN